MKFLFFLVLVAGGMGMVVYSFQIVRTFGHMEWAERYLGSGGSYLAWKLIGMALIIGGFWVLAKG